MNHSNFRILLKFIITYSPVRIQALMKESGYLSSVGAEDSFGSYLSRSACSLFGRMLCESSTFSISHFTSLVTNRVSLFPGTWSDR